MLGTVLALVVFCGAQIRYSGRYFYLYPSLALILLPLSFFTLMYEVELFLK